MSSQAQVLILYCSHQIESLRRLIPNRLKPQILLPPQIPPKSLNLAPPSLLSTISLGRQTQQIVFVVKLVWKSKDIITPYQFRVPFRLDLFRDSGISGAKVGRRRCGGVTRRFWWCWEGIRGRSEWDCWMVGKVGEFIGPEEGDEV